MSKDANKIVEQDITEEEENKADESAATDGALGDITGLLVGLGTLAISNIEPILLAGIEAIADIEKQTFEKE